MYVLIFFSVLTGSNLFWNLQLNISLFARSNYNLQFNLYPLKAWWQQLPEFEIKFNTTEDIVPEKRSEDHLNNLELQKLVERWIPKKVFILVMIYTFIILINLWNNFLLNFFVFFSSQWSVRCK